MKYYYLAASLPMLSMDASPPISLDTFRALCAEHLSAHDYRALEALLAGAADPHAFVGDWNRVETALRNACVRERAGRLKRDPVPFLRREADLDTAMARHVAAAFARRTPLEREHALDRLRWDLAEELAGFDPFSSRALLAYALQLRLAERWARMDPGAGDKTLESLVNREPEAQEKAA